METSWTGGKVCLDVTIAVDGPVKACIGPPVTGIARYMFSVDNTPTGPVHEVSSLAGSKEVCISLNMTTKSVPQEVCTMRVNEDWDYSESMQGIAAITTFYRFTLPEGSVIASPKKRPWIKIFGDSDTAGFCTDGSPTAFGNISINANWNVTWGHQLAQMLEMETITVAVSGIGVNGLWAPTFPTYYNTNQSLPSKYARPSCCVHRSRMAAT